METAMGSRVFGGWVRTGSAVSAATYADGRHREVRVTMRQLAILVGLQGDTRRRSTVETLAADWPGLSVSAARARVAALEAKGLVCRDGWAHGGAWHWVLTRLGAAFMDEMPADWPVDVGGDE